MWLRIFAVSVGEKRMSVDGNGGTILKMLNYFLWEGMEVAFSIEVKNV